MGPGEGPRVHPSASCGFSRLPATATKNQQPRDAQHGDGTGAAPSASGRIAGASGPLGLCSRHLPSHTRISARWASPQRRGSLQARGQVAEGTPLPTGRFPQRDWRPVVLVRRRRPCQRRRTASPARSPEDSSRNAPPSARSHFRAGETESRRRRRRGLERRAYPCEGGGAPRNREERSGAGEAPSLWNTRKRKGASPPGRSRGLGRKEGGSPSGHVRGYGACSARPQRGSVRRERRRRRRHRRFLRVASSRGALQPREPVRGLDATEGGGRAGRQAGGAATWKRRWVGLPPDRRRAHSQQPPHAGRMASPAAGAAGAAEPPGAEQQHAEGPLLPPPPLLWSAAVGPAHLHRGKSKIFPSENIEKLYRFIQTKSCVFRTRGVAASEPMGELLCRPGHGQSVKAGSPSISELLMEVPRKLEQVWA